MLQVFIVTGLWESFSALNPHSPCTWNNRALWCSQTVFLSHRKWEPHMFNILTCAMLAQYMWLTAVIIGFPQVSSSNQKVVSPFHLWISWEPTLTQLPSAHWVNGGAEWGLRLVAGRWLGVLVCPCAPGMAWSCWEKLCCRLKDLPQLFSEEFSKLSGTCLTPAMFSEESQLLAVIAWAGTRWLVPCESGAVEGLFLLVGKWGKDPVYAVPQLKVSLMAKPKNSKMNVFWRGFKPPSLVPQGW